MPEKENAPRVVVVGGGYAGLMACRTLSDSGAAVEITLIDARDHFVDRIRLHEFAAGKPVPNTKFDQRLDRGGIGFIHARVIAVEPGECSLTLEFPDSSLETLGYDWLVLALGSYTDTSSVPGAAQHTHTLDDVEGALELWRTAREAAERHGHLIVIGGGLTGIEAAAEFGETFKNLRVTLLSLDPVGGAESTEARGYITDRLGGLGVAVKEGVAVTAIEAGQLRLADGGALAFDICIWAGGYAIPGLAREAGLAVNEHGQIQVDSHLRCPDYPNILAAGDMAAAISSAGAPLRLSCATAVHAGRFAGNALARLITGEALDPFAFSYKMHCISLGRNDAVIQFVDGGDQPLAEFWTGTKAAQTKAYICEATSADSGMAKPVGPPPHPLP